MKRIKYLGADRSGPVGMDCNPYSEGSKAWNTVVDFACMDKTEFTLEESAAYHGIEVEFYTDDVLEQLTKDGLIEVKS